MSDTKRDADPTEAQNAGPDASVRRWVMELESYEESAKTWKADAKRIVKRYALEERRSQTETIGYDEPGMNILWANTQTIHPAMFASEPVPVVQRRHRDPDPVGRMAAQILERALVTEMEMDGWIDVFDQLTLDVLLVARGVPWVRYAPEIRKVKERDEQTDDDGNVTVVEREEERLAGQRAPVDYVYWDDFAHAPKKTWPEVVANGWVGRKVRMTRKQGMARFGDVFKDVPLNYRPMGDTDENTVKRMKPVMGTADVWEIWDAEDRKAIWLCKEYSDKLLDEQDDPLGLDGFFPCPMPAFGSRSNEKLVPIPDYIQYEPLADEVDDITERISRLIPALRAAGVYDSRIPGLGRLFTDSSGQNDLVGVDGIAQFQASGSTGSTIAGVLQFVPLDTIAGALAALYDARDRAIQKIFEISGVSDIIRGQVDPREKLGQSQLKGRFASQRLDKRRRAIETAARDTIRIKAEIMAEQYAPETLRQLSGFDFLPEIVKLREESGDDPTAVEQRFQAAFELLRDEKMRGFRVEVETNSMVVLDQNEEQEARTQFLEAAGSFLERVLPVAQAAPILAPLLSKMMLFTVRGFRAGRTLESEFENLAEEITEAARQPQEPPPDPAAEAEAAKAQAEAERAQIQTQAAGEKAALDSQRQQQQMAAEERRAQLKVVGDQASAEVAAQKAQTAMEEMEARLLATITELQVRVEQAERMAQIKTRGALEQVAAKKAGDSD